VKRSALGRLAVSLAAIALLVACSSGESAPSDEADVKAQDKVLQQYITAVQEGDRARLAKLAGPRVDAGAEIDAKIRAIGGRQWSSVQVTWKRNEFPALAKAEISAVDPAGQPVRDSVLLTEVDDTWYVGLGAAPDARTPADTRTP
jgi:outer membrane biogenesis lipoprotein LolB